MQVPPRLPGITLAKKEVFRKKRLVRRAPIRRQGYNVYGKQIKTGRYIRLNRVSLTQARARDLGSYIADHSLSTNFKIKKAVGKARKPQTRIPQGYYSRVKGSFRDYRIRKGKRIPMKNKWIEKRGLPRLNTRGEKQKITMLKKLAEVRKKAVKKAKRKVVKKRKRRVSFF